MTYFDYLKADKDKEDEIKRLRGIIETLSAEVLQLQKEVRKFRDLAEKKVKK